MSTSPHIRCAFCKARADQVDHLVKGRTSVMICDLCVADAVEVIEAAKIMAPPGPKPMAEAS